MTLSAANFSVFLAESRDDIAVLFYQPMCGHCQDALPAFAKVPEWLQQHEAPCKGEDCPHTACALLDASEHDVSDVVRVDEVPSVLLFTVADHGIVDFEGDASDTAAIGRFLLANRKQGGCVHFCCSLC